MGFDLSAEQDAFRRRARELADTVLAARVQKPHPPLLIGGYAEAGVTELFLDPNFQAGVPSLAPVLQAMESLAPGG